MAEDLSPDLAGRGKRVGGAFILMIGASIILDTHAVWMGLPLLAGGAALFAWGLAEAREQTSPAAAVRDATTEPQP